VLSETVPVNVCVGDWVAAEYNQKWYVGQVLKVDDHDEYAYVTF